MTRLFGHTVCTKCGESYGSFTYNGGPVRVKSGLCVWCKSEKLEEAGYDVEERKS